MDYSKNPKVIGAFLVGFALIIASYVVSNFGKPTGMVSNSLSAVAEVAPVRVFIPVTDNNTDGLEDWRDQFITAPAVDLSLTTAKYVPPTTLTGQLGISIMEDLITSKGSGSLGRSRESLIGEAVERLGHVASDDIIYDVKNIIISSDNTDAYIRLYGNTLANILINESVPELKNEILLLQDLLADPSAKNILAIKTLSEVYKNYRDKTLQTPVPKKFVKQHLDLVNVYNALFLDIENMSQAVVDPALPFIRLKRYEDDVEGLTLALRNMYNSFVPYAKVFKKDDPAILLVNFSGELQ